MVCVCVPADVASDGSARVIVSSATDTASIADDTSLSSSSPFSDDGDVVVVVVVVLATPSIVFFRPGHGIHHWPKHSLIKAATVHGRACPAG